MANESKVQPLSESAEPGLQKTPGELCRAYGVRIEPDERGRYFARHNVAGVLGPFDTEARAELEACAVWLAR